MDLLFGMPSLIHSAIFRLVVALVMTIGMLLPPIGGESASHDPAAPVASEATLERELTAQIADYDYDGGLEDEQRPGRPYGHSPDDHSHEIPYTLNFVRAAIPLTGRIWHGRPPVFTDPETTSRLERPPRTFFVM
ncbi:hypothetical protein MXD81_53575 [Microbacteriaceae bacterium K1510]|nr:hypothetical protein [Microbacteriaceae bacterium K1510]